MKRELSYDVNTATELFLRSEQKQCSKAVLSLLRDKTTLSKVWHAGSVAGQD